MIRLITLVVAVALPLSSVAHGESAGASENDGDSAATEEEWTAAKTGDETFETLVEMLDRAGERSSERRRPVSGPPLVESRVIDPAMCEPGSSVGYDPVYSYRCDGFDLECADDEILQPPRETRARLTAEGPWSPWTALSGWTCVTPSEDDLITAVRTAFAEMTITPSPITVIDGRGWTFVQIDTVIYSNADPQTLTTTVAGIPVELRATPIEWTWNFGDDTPTKTTTTPGGPYPNKSVTHVYTTLGTYTVALTTIWQGQWRLPSEDTWRDITDRNLTTSTSDPFTTHELRTRLVKPPS